MGLWSWISRKITPPHVLAVREAESRALIAEASRRAAAAEQSVMRMKRKANHVSAMETFWYGGAYNDFLAPLIDRLNELIRDPTFYPWTGTQAHRYGGKWPIFQSEQELNLQRTISRAVYDANTHGQGLIGGVGAYVIGEGMTARATSKERNSLTKKLIAKVQDWYDEFEEVNLFQEMQQEAFIRGEVDGEYFWRHFPQENGQTLLRHVWPEHVVQPPGETISDTWSYGIESAEGDIQTPVAYFIAPDGLTDEGEEVEAGMVDHVRRNVWSGVKRGLPGLILDLRDLLEGARKVRRNTADGVAVQAAIAYIRQHAQADEESVGDLVESETDYQPPRFSQLGDTTRNTQTVESGQVVDIDSGQEYIEPPGASNASAYIEVMQACLRNAGVRYNAPEWLASGDSSNNNFASGLVAEAPFVRRSKQIQGFYGRRFRRTIRRAHKHAVDIGRLPRESWGVVDIQLEPPSLVVREEDKEANVNKTYFDMKIKSPQTIQQELNLDTENEKTNFDAWQQLVGPESGPMGQPQPGGDAGGAASPFTQQQGEQDQSQQQGGGGQPGADPFDQNQDTVLSHEEAMAQGGTPMHPDELSDEPHPGGDEDDEDEAGGDDDDEDQFDIAFSPLTEQALLEQGFTGTIHDSRGREFRYVNGKRVGKAGKKQVRKDPKISAGKFKLNGAGKANASAGVAGMNGATPKTPSPQAETIALPKQSKSGPQHAVEVARDWSLRRAEMHGDKFAVYFGMDAGQVKKKLGGILRNLAVTAVGKGSASIVVKGKNGKRLRITVRFKGAGQSTPLATGKPTPIGTSNQPPFSPAALGESEYAEFGGFTLELDADAALFEIAYPLDAVDVDPDIDAVMEGGFTGMITDKRGRKMYYKDGKRVKGPKSGEQTQQQQQSQQQSPPQAGQQQTPASPSGQQPQQSSQQGGQQGESGQQPNTPSRSTIDSTVKHVEDMRGSGFTLDKLSSLATMLQGHTVKELTEIKKQLGLKASGPKAELARKIAQRALADTSDPEKQQKSVTPPTPSKPSAAKPASAPTSPSRKQPAAKPVAKPTEQPAIGNAAGRMAAALKKSKESKIDNEADAKRVVEEADKLLPELQKMSEDELRDTLSLHGEKGVPAKMSKKALVNLVHYRLASPGNVWLENQV